MSDSLEQPNPNEPVESRTYGDTTGCYTFATEYELEISRLTKALAELDATYRQAAMRYHEQSEEYRAALAEARQEVERLKAENDELGLVASATVVGMANGVHAVGKVKELNGVINHLHKELDKSDAELTALRERNARLEEGLKRAIELLHIYAVQQNADLFPYAQRHIDEFNALLASGSGDGQ